MVSVEDINEAVNNRYAVYLENSRSQVVAHKGQEYVLEQKRYGQEYVLEGKEDYFGQE